MKKAILILFALVFSVFMLKSYGQEESEKMKTFGLGLHVEQFKMGDVYTDFAVAPANKVIFTINATNHLRIEPEVGFNFCNDKDNDLKDQSLHTGIGVFYMFQPGKVNIYTGVRFELAQINEEYKSWQTEDKYTDKSVRTTFAPAIGAEYFFGKHFSLGAEIALKYSNLKTKYGNPDNEDRKRTYFSTDTGVLLRFYF
ncbi:MAG: porin family protein [Bacteroidales bacterium]|nr:porin family protein [Bacteroidales bacterium]